MDVSGIMLGILTGMISTIFSSNYINAKQINEEAFRAAILIRVWLINNNNNIITFEKEVSRRRELFKSVEKASELKDEHIENFSEFLEDSKILEIKTSIEKLSSVSKKFERYENIIEMLLKAQNYVNQVNNFKNKFEQLKKESLTSSTKISEKEWSEKIEQTIELCKSEFKKYQEGAEKAEEFIKGALEKFQEKICIPLRIPVIGLTNEIISTEQFLKEI